MIYGKAECAIASEHGRLHITVTAGMVSLKQNNDLIRLSLDEARELSQDLDEAISHLLIDPSNNHSNNGAS